jgi:hypothetical protein
MEPEADARAARRVARVLLLAVLGVQLVAAWQPPPWILHHLTFDDTFLLLQVARGWADGGHPTFDGLHHTNGFQALWGTLVWLVALAVPGRTLLLHATLSLAALLNTLTGWLLYRFALRRASSASAVWVLAVWACFCLTPRPGQCGLENALVGVCVSGALLAWRARVAPVGLAAAPGGAVLLLALLSGLGVWARLDIAVLAGVFWCRAGWDLLRARRWAMFATVAGVALAMGGLLAAFNLWAGGTPTPVSGLVKRLIAQRLEPAWTWPWAGQVLADSSRVLLKQAAVGVGAIWPPALSSLVRGLLVLLGVGVLVRRPAALRGWVGLWLFALVLHVVALRVWLGAYHLDTFWYFMPQQLSAALGAGLLIGRWREPRPPGRPRVRGALLVGLCKLPLLAVLIGQAAPPDSNAAVRLETAAWLRAHVPPSERVAAWNAGILAYFSECRVVNLDGLVNSREYCERLARGAGVRDYLAELNIDYVVDYARDARRSDTHYWGELSHADWEPVAEVGAGEATQLVVRRR